MSIRDDLVKFDPINNSEHCAWLEVSCEVLIPDYMENTFMRFYYMLELAPFDYIDERELYLYDNLESAVLTYMHSVGVSTFFANWFRMCGLSKYLHKLAVAKRTSRRWTFVKVYIVIMGVYKRATVSANHPECKRTRGEFEIEGTDENDVSVSKSRRSIL